VVAKSEAEIARERISGSETGDGKSPLLAQNECEEDSVHGTIGVAVVIPWIYASVDPAEKWWVRLRGNPKRSGEISQAAFLLKAETMGFDVALPWGDNQKFDFLLRQRSGRAIRVQVKGTGRLHRRGYEVQPSACNAEGRKETVYEERYRCDCGARAARGCVVSDTD
jgi:hypothetical protein